MSLWTIIETVLDWICNWRFNVCFWGGVLLALTVPSYISYQPLQWIAAGFFFVTGVIIGIRWDSSH